MNGRRRRFVPHADPAAGRRGGAVPDQPARLTDAYCNRSSDLKHRSHVTKANAPRGICASSAEVARLDQMRRHGNASQSAGARLRRSTSTRTWRKIPATCRATNELGYLTFGNGIRSAIECHED